MKHKKILVLGATGQTGIQIVDRALKIGYAVRALVRHDTNAFSPHANLEVVAGDPLNVVDLEKSLQGCDAVIFALGQTQKWNSLIVGSDSPNHLLRDVTRHLAKLMVQQDVKRIVAISAYGAGDSFRYVPFWLKLMIKYTGIKQPYLDHGDQEKILKDSLLDWTIVRMTRLTDEKSEKRLIVSFDGTPKPENYISRKAAAEFCVNSLDNAELIKKIPVLSEI